MAVPKPKVSKATKLLNATRLFKATKPFKILLSVFLFLFIATSGAILYYYHYYAGIIDRKLDGEVFKNTAQIYAAPYRIYPGQKLTLQDVTERLQRAGFALSDKDRSDGVYEVENNKVTVRPKVGDTLRLEFRKTSLARIIRLPNGDTSQAWLPAELVTNLFDESRQKRRIVQFDDLPKPLVNALIAAEDQRFFSHWGIDPIRLAGAVIDSFRDSDKVRGTSTLTQQLARNFFLTPDRSMKRKVHEMFISFLLEQRLTKEQILTMYANEVYLGQRGSFSIHGFGEGAAAYFGKDLASLTLPEAATLVSIIPSPNGMYSATKRPQEVKRRRNIILASMHNLGTLDDDDFERARNTEVKVAPIKVDATDAPYLVDFIREELLRDFSDEEVTSNSLRVYTSLDPDLQRAAVDALQKGLKSVQDQVAARNKGRKIKDNLPAPQAALIALDPHTGEIKAMVGGGDYGASQYNRITQAFRQPGSIFKPFVYAAAFETAFDSNSAAPAEADGDVSQTDGTTTPEPQPADAEENQYDSARRNAVITPITSLVDEPTTFANDGSQPYEPNNYKQQYRGQVTVRTALQHSLNIPTIKVAERIGYGRVASFARRLGLNAKIKGYPSIALGAFEVTPIEMAGAYTAFANEGRRMQPHALVRVTSADGSTNKSYKYEPKEVMRPELAYLMTYLMEGVVNSGTGAGVRARGFTLPAAGKTGTSRDGWFAGYTKDLLAIAWVGYDDNRDLNVEGARSALPIWTDFMIKASRLYPPRNSDDMYFDAPSGIEFARVDAESLLLAKPGCIDTFEEAFITGTAPTSYCPLHETFTISNAVTDAVTDGVVEVGKGVVEAGKGVAEAGKGAGSVVKRIGRFFGGIFGGGGDRDGDDREKH
jgi:penicillin-binding protein 1B